MHGFVCVVFLITYIALFVRKAGAQCLWQYPPFGKNSKIFDNIGKIKNPKQRAVAAEAKTLIQHAQVRRAFCSQFITSSQNYPTCIIPVSLNSSSGIKPMLTNWCTPTLSTTQLAHTFHSEKPTRSGMKLGQYSMVRCLFTCLMFLFVCDLRVRLHPT